MHVGTTPCCIIGVVRDGLQQSHGVICNGFQLLVSSGSCRISYMCSIDSVVIGKSYVSISVIVSGRDVERKDRGEEASWYLYIYIVEFSKD